MSFGKPLPIYALNSGWSYAFEPTQANRLNDVIQLVKQNYHSIRCQVVTSLDASYDSAGKATSHAADLSQYDDAIFGFKSSEDATDFTAAWRGYNATDSGWHSLSNGRFSIDVAPVSSLTAGRYYGQIRLINATSYFDISDFGFRVFLLPNLISGSEPSTPGGSLTGSDYSGTITDGTDSVTIAVSGMTTSGVVIPYFKGNPVSTIGATCATNAVTVTIGGPASGNVNVGIYVRSR